MINTDLNVENELYTNVTNIICTSTASILAHIYVDHKMFKFFFYPHLVKRNLWLEICFRLVKQIRKTVFKKNNQLMILKHVLTQRHFRLLNVKS